MTSRLAITFLAVLAGCCAGSCASPSESAGGAGGAPAAGPAGTVSAAGMGVDSSLGGDSADPAGTAGVNVAGRSGSESAGGAGSASAADPAGAGSNTSGGAGQDSDPALPSRASVLEVLRRANAYFSAKWPDPAKTVDSSHPSHIWTRSVYYEGLLALYGVDPKASDLEYALAWAKSHSWGLNTGTTTRNADNQCAGQTYLDLYAIERESSRIKDIQTDIDMVVAGAAVDDWTWIDAIQMAMPVFAKLGVLTGKSSYYEKMYAMYSNTKRVQGAAGLYSKSEHLWWRDENYDPPYTEPNGESCYWSRGNGWVFAALTRVLDTIPESEPHRVEYLADFIDMAEALRGLQRTDGFWNVSLHDPTHFGGPELTGTSLFTYGMAWGVRKGLLPAASYRPVIEQAWQAMASSVHENGFLGYVQGTAAEPADSQPVSFDKQPNYEDFGLGCFLLGGSEVARLAPR
ncbi:MAG TPA: glycoside hydrolase family 88 protein [Polyangiaceae bacterium]|nr:glycoside hydrolase family 88 protein [Polyangiaceae bacterium]